MSVKCDVAGSNVHRFARPILHSFLKCAKRNQIKQDAAGSSLSANCPLIFQDCSAFMAK